jgi:monoamine oxidase
MKSSRRSAIQAIASLGAASGVSLADTNTKAQASKAGLRDPINNSMLGAVDVAVIGAGFAGLTAALAIKASGKRVTLIEARDRVGGRTEAVLVAGLKMDVGGMWVGPQQSRLLTLAEKYGIRKYPTFLNGRNIIEFGGKSTQSKGEDWEASMSITQKLDYVQVESKLKELVDSLSVDMPWTHYNAKVLDGMTFQSWLDTACYTEGVKTIFHAICGSILCCTPEQISPLFFAWYLRSSGGLNVLIQTKGGAQDAMFHGGMHQIAARMASELNEHLSLSNPVRKIHQDADNVKLITDKFELKAKKVVVAIPAPLYKTIDFSPNLPSSKIALSQRSPMGSVIKILVAYKTPFWRDQGFNGFTSRVGSLLSPTFDVTPPQQPLGVLVGFIDADLAIKMSEIAPAQRKLKILAELAKSFGQQALEPLDYVERSWIDEKWSQGCYGAYMTPGTMTRYGAMRQSRYLNIHWAGTETANQWSGYVEGAIESGQRVAREVLEALNKS